MQPTAPTTSLTERALNDRYDVILQVIAESDSDSQVAPALLEELAEIIIQLETL